MKSYKPMLAPNDKVNLDKIKYPLFASFKLDGIRSEFMMGDMLSRSLKQIQNKQLRQKMQPLIEHAEKNGLILDGEIYSHELTFQEITSCVMTKDYNDKTAIKRWNDLFKDNPSEYYKGIENKKTREHAFNSLKFYMFDCVANNDFEIPFHARVITCNNFQKDYPNLVSAVNQITVHSKEDVEEYFEIALKEGYEGLILKDPNGRYKCGRGTIKEGLIYKVKPFVTFDAEVIGVVQSTEVNPDAEKKINELGRSVTSKKLGDRLLIDKAAAFEVEYSDLCDKCLARGKTGIITKSEGECSDCSSQTHILKVVLAMTDDEKEAVWANRGSYIGKIIEYKGMLIGSKDVPRHPVMLRFREDKK